MTLALSNASHAEGFNTMACCSTYLFDITAFDNTAKTVTLDGIGSLAVGSILALIVHDPNQSYRNIFNLEITAINNLTVTLDTTETITSNWQYAVYTDSAINTVHAEGNCTSARGIDSHAEGYGTLAGGQYSHSQNLDTIAQGKCQTVIGKYNVAQGTSYLTNSSDYAFIIGNGTSDTARSNALTVDWSGNLAAAGTVSEAGTSLANKYVAKAGGTMTGILTAQNNTSYTTKQVRNIIISTSDATLSSMANGDIWIKI